MTHIPPIKKILLTTSICTSILAASAFPAFAVTDEEFAALKAQMSSFSEKLAELEGEQSELKQENAMLKEQNEVLQKQNAALEEDLHVNVEKIAQIQKMSEVQMTNVANIEPAAGGGNPSNGMLIPGTDTRVKLGGYVKVDAIHDFNTSRDGNGEDFGLYAAIPLEGSTEERQGSNTRIHARQTRLNLTATTPTEYGDLKVFVEGDFLDSQGSQNTTNRASFGLRHAYGQLDSFLFGQTWSNYMDLAAYPESLDFQGVSGNTLLRQGQMRYTYTPEGSKNSFSVAIENPSSDVINSPSNSGISSDLETYPDVTAKYRVTGDFGEFSLKGVGRYIEAYNSTVDSSEGEFGYAVGVSGKLKAFEKDDFRFQVAYGDGIGRYIFDLAAASQAAGYNANADAIDTIEAWGGYAAYRHWWTDDLRSNLIAGTTQIIENPDYLTASTTNESVMSAHGNLIWSVTPKFDIGAEYIYGHRETEDGSEGKLQRAQVSATYKF